MTTTDEKPTPEKQPSSTDVKVPDDNISVSQAKSITQDEIVTLDASELFLREHNFSEEYLAELLTNEAMNKRLVRKVDFVILPLLAGTFVLQYIGKQAMSYATVFDLFTETSITSDQYAWFTSMFYFAYLVAEYPWMWAAQKTRMVNIVSACVTLWGAMLMITASAKTFAGLGICRVFLGVFEAPVTTCFMMIFAMWYTRPEQPFRAGICYCCNGVGSIISGILTYGIGQIESFPVWKAIFLLCGGITVMWGLTMFFFLPDSVISAKRFSLDEKALLIARGRLGKTGILNQTIKWSQVRETFVDPQVWLLFLFVMLNETINGGYANFGKLIVKGLVSNPLETTMLNLPQGGFQVMWILSGTWIASRYKNQRTIVMALYILPTIIGVGLIWKMDQTTYANKIGVLIGYYISGAYVTSLVLALQMPTVNMGGYTKRTTSSALVFLAYCASNVIGPHAFLSKEKPYYETRCKLILACAVAQACVAFGLRAMLQARNKKRDEGAAAAGGVEDQAYDGADATDFENRSFRYVL